MIRSVRKLSCFSLTISLLLCSCTHTKPGPMADESQPHTLPIDQQPIQPELPSLDKPASDMITEPMRRPLPLSLNKAVVRLLNEAKLAGNDEKWELASSHIERAYRIDNNDPNILITKAIFLFKQAKYSEAESWAQRSLRLIPKDGIVQQLTAWEVIAAARIELNKPEELKSEAETRVLQLQDMLD